MANALPPGTSSKSGVLLHHCRKNAASTGWMAALLVLGTLWGAGENRCRAEEKPKAQLLFLVARDVITDPYFERSVVLVLPLEGQPVIVGLVVNKPTRLPVLKLFPKSPILKSRSENTYLGGPVDLQAPALAFHTQKPPKGALQLYDDVYLSFDLKSIGKLMQYPKQAGDVRFFLGRAQWAPEQLQGEAMQGGWYSLRAEGDVIFEPDPEHVWKRLRERARQRLNVQDRRPQRGSPAFDAVCRLPAELW